tara:strand:+ start:577 stop:1611 length:1035 start_codon:yes stop_codon:yes gene_type:complete
MAMQQVEYEFPDPESGGTAINVDMEEKEGNNLEIEGAVGREEIKTPKKAEVESLEIEIEDDTPIQDRGRKPSKPPEEVTDDELENYSEKVKGRIKHFSKGYHDERRAKETAVREREELETYARSLMEENKKLKGTVDKNQLTMVEQAKQTVARELQIAKRQYKDAYEAGDSDAIADAQEAIATAKIRADKVASYRPTPLQVEETPVQIPQQPKETETFRDEQATAWADENSWFGSQTPDGLEMTAFALGLDAKLKKNGVDPQSNEYYEQINSRMRQVFPDQFDDGIEDEPVEPKRKSSNVVAPATRSTSPRKVTLNQSQVAIAKRLGISLEDYAKQAAELMRNK